MLTDDLKQVALSFYEGLDVAHSLSAAILLRYGEYAQLVSLAAPPSLFLNHDSYRRAAAATGLLAKIDADIPGLSPELSALKSWYAAEHRCFRTNSYLNHLMDFGPADSHDECFLEFLRKIRKKMEFLIGSAPPDVFDGVFGPGATVSDMAGETTVFHKMSSDLTLTQSALFYLVPWSGTSWARTKAQYSDKPYSIVRGNVYFQVNKNAKIKRSCAKEPSLNSYYQRGAGEVMARRLRARGIVISPQKTYVASLKGDGCIVESGVVAPERHKEMARRASRDGSLATIDSSMASDTICYALVKAVTPSRWFAVLNDLRSPTTSVPRVLTNPETGEESISNESHTVLLEKFSSMGNGYTFELETAIFAAIALALDENLVLGESLSVFGDDVILPTRLAKLYMQALEALGFIPNQSKTFISGPFRESCGGDYFDGHAVRPYNIKELPREPQEWISVANGIRRLAYQDDYDTRLWRDLRRSWFRALDNIPSAIRKCRGPEILGDLVIHDNEASWSCRTRSQIRYIRVWRVASGPRVYLRSFCSDTVMSGLLYGCQVEMKGQYGSILLQKPVPFNKRYINCRPVKGRDKTSYKLGWLPYS